MVRIADFGALLKFPGQTAGAYLADTSHVSKVTDVVKGDEITVMVTNIDSQARSGSLPGAAGRLTLEEAQFHDSRGIKAAIALAAVDGSHKTVSIKTCPRYAGRFNY